MAKVVFPILGKRSGVVHEQPKKSAIGHNKKFDTNQSHNYT